MRIVVITGASGGLGREMAMVFSKHGDQIVLHYHSGRTRAEEIATEIRAYGSQAMIHQADIRNRQSVQEMATTVVKEWGKIDLWINNAGMTHDRLVDRIQSDEWEEVITTNLHGAFYGIQEAARVMVHQMQGHIINISSIVGFRGAAGQAAYTASKAGLIGLAKSAARELGPFNIQVNAVLPGYLPTPMTQKLPQKRSLQIIKENVLGRTSDLDEVTQFIHHLSLMQHVSGQVFNLDSRIF
ncbi:MAG: SDR family NAD(P)-dependent oxidoreductase [Nitrospira sp.]|nr:SDR family NAD(P)-dependent oxidoreductase [Nitrospira sp.]